MSERIEVKFRGVWGGKPNKVFWLRWRTGDDSVLVWHRNVEVGFHSWPATTLLEAVERISEILSTGAYQR